MSLLPVIRRSQLLRTVRCAPRFYATDSKGKGPAQEAADANPPVAAATTASPEGTSRSSCPEGTVLEGLNWLKGQPPVIAQADDAYPEWLWKLLEPKVIPDDGPGGKAEKVRLRRENRQRIRDQNFMKTQ